MPHPENSLLTAGLSKTLSNRAEKVSSILFRTKNRPVSGAFRELEKLKPYIADWRYNLFKSRIHLEGIRKASKGSLGVKELDNFGGANILKKVPISEFSFSNIVSGINALEAADEAKYLMDDKYNSNYEAHHNYILRHLLKHFYLNNKKKFSAFVESRGRLELHPGINQDLAKARIRFLLSAGNAMMTIASDKVDSTDSNYYKHGEIKLARTYFDKAYDLLKDYYRIGDPDLLYYRDYLLLNADTKRGLKYAQGFENIHLGNITRRGIGGGLSYQLLRGRIEQLEDHQSTGQWYFSMYDKPDRSEYDGWDEDGF